MATFLVVDGSWLDKKAHFEGAMTGKIGGYDCCVDETRFVIVLGSIYVDLEVVRHVLIIGLSSIHAGVLIRTYEDIMVRSGT